MVNWRESMQQTFEYYIVDPGTWKDVRPLRNVRSCTITRDLDTETLGSATIDIDESLGECYVRVYMIVIQNGVRSKHPMGTFLLQTPSSNFDGKKQDITVDAYTPLLELKDNPPPLGYSVLKDSNTMSIAYRLVRENARAPVIETTCSDKLFSNFVSNTSDTWLSFISDLISNAKYRFDLDEMGRILFSPKQDTASLQPVWTYEDNEISILHPDLSWSRDLYGVPNAVEIIYTNGFYDETTKSKKYHVKIVNDDPNSPISTVRRGREVLHREVNPNISGSSTSGMVTESVVRNYAESALRTLSSLENSITYTHAYCPVRIGDCIRLNHTRANMTDVKAKVISQTIKCTPGCPVTEKAIYTTKLWG